jgi:hypothetical protein
MDNPLLKEGYQRRKRNRTTKDDSMSQTDVVFAMAVSACEWGPGSNERVEWRSKFETVLFSRRDSDLYVLLVEQEERKRKKKKTMNTMSQPGKRKESGVEP